MRVEKFAHRALRVINRVNNLCSFKIGTEIVIEKCHYIRDIVVTVLGKFICLVGHERTHHSYETKHHYGYHGQDQAGCHSTAHPPPSQPIGSWLDGECQK